jgi:hypothetical protein
MPTFSTHAELTAHIDLATRDGIEGFTLIGCRLVGELLCEASRDGYLGDFYGMEGEAIGIDCNGIVNYEYYACGSFGE